MITTVTLNASIDKAYYMDRDIKNGTVMRVASHRNTAGGKGLNVARIIKLCGAQVQAAGLVGGYNGQYLESLLNEDGIPHRFIHVKGETRSCINILDRKYGSTEYLEPGCEVTPEEETQFLEAFPEIIGTNSVVTISGSVPKGIRQDIYQRMISIAKEMGKQVILDTSGEPLKYGLQACPTMIKPNRDEMELMLNRRIGGIQDLITSAKQLYATGISYVVVSLGGDGALMVCREGVFIGTPPKVEVVNTVGCGDSMVGAFAVALERNDPAKEALKYAVAVSAANALSPHTGDFEPEVCKNLIGGVCIERL